MAAAPIAVVIGASRGVGYALAEALQETGYTVLATLRKGAQDLQKLGVEVVEGVDIAADDGCEAITGALGDRQVSLLIVAAGVQEVDTLETVSKDSIRRQFEINAVGPLFAVKELQHKLKKAAKVVLISSKMASFASVEQTGGEMYGYRIGKVAVNMIGRTLAVDLKQMNDSPVALIHPGVVNTDMLRSLRRQRGVAEDQLTANTISQEDSAAGIVKLIDGLNLENSGTFWAADSGQALSW